MNNYKPKKEVDIVAKKYKFSEELLDTIDMGMDIEEIVEELEDIEVDDVIAEDVKARNKKMRERNSKHIVWDEKVEKYRVSVPAYNKVTLPLGYYLNYGQAVIDYEFAKKVIYKLFGRFRGGKVIGYNDNGKLQVYNNYSCSERRRIEIERKAIDLSRERVVKHKRTIDRLKAQIKELQERISKRDSKRIAWHKKCIDKRIEKLKATHKETLKRNREKFARVKKETASKTRTKVLKEFERKRRRKTNVIREARQIIRKIEKDYNITIDRMEELR